MSLIESKQRREQCLITALFVLIISLQLTNSPKLLNIYFIKLMKPWKLSDPSVKEDSLTQLVFIPMGSQKELSSVKSYLHIFYKEQYSKVESTNSLQVWHFDVKLKFSLYERTRFSRFIQTMITMTKWKGGSNLNLKSFKWNGNAFNHMRRWDQQPKIWWWRGGRWWAAGGGPPLPPRRGGLWAGVAPGPSGLPA